MHSTTLLVLLLALGAGAEHRDVTSKIAAKVQPILDAQAAHWNTSFSLGITIDGKTLALAAGVDNHATTPPTKVSPASLYPMGSATKLYTAVSALHLVEQGVLELDLPIHTFLDPFLSKTNGTTLMKLFNDPRINTVTTRHLLSMQSGIADYDDDKVQAWTLNKANVGKDLTPYDYLAIVNKTLLFTPGKGGSYSSVGYDLAGLALAAISKAATWQEFNQRAIFPPSMPLPGITFPLEGACSSYPNVTSQYIVATGQWESPYWISFAMEDMIWTSCLNGWTCGNLAAAPGDVSKALYNVISPHAPVPLVNKSSLKQMMDFEPLTTGWSTGLKYGLGMFNTTMCSSKDVDPKYTTFVGHAGQDYGSGAPWHYYNAATDASIVLATNSLYGMNCSLEDLSSNGGFSQAAGCAVWGAVLDVLSNGTVQGLDCGSDQQQPLLQKQKQDAILTRTNRTAILTRTNRTLRGVLDAVDAGPTLPVHCFGSKGVCSGESAHVSAGECYAWQAFHSRAGGAAWAQCASSWADPCACTGVTCSDDGHITEIDLQSSGAYGELPPEFASLTSLTALNLANTSLFGPLPSMPFTKFSSCDLSSTQFDCPLPSGAASCHPPSSPAPTCASATPHLSQSCLMSVAKIWTNAAYTEAQAAMQEAANIVGKYSTQNCSHELQAKHVCHATFDWSLSPKLQPLITAVQDAAKAVDSSAAECWVTIDETRDIEGLGECELILGKVSLMAWTDTCSDVDRANMLKWMSSPAKCWAQGASDCKNSWYQNACKAPMVTSLDT